MTTHPAPQLAPERLYLAEDRYVCGTTRCAGYHALYTGHTTSGVEVIPVEWAALALGWDQSDPEPMTCECGAVTVTPEVHA